MRRTSRALGWSQARYRFRVLAILAVAGASRLSCVDHEARPRVAGLGGGAVSAVTALSLGRWLRQPPASSHGPTSLDERGGRPAWHPALHRPRARAPRRAAGETCREALALPARSARRGHHAARRSGRLEAPKRRLKSPKRYSRALLRSAHDDAAQAPKRRNPRGCRDLSKRERRDSNPRPPA
jgi:hypothetical protein